MEASTFNILAVRLGVASDFILKKALELARIVESKSKNSSLSSLNVSSTSIAVICIELAASHNSHHVDKDAAIRLSTLPKKAYLTAYKIIQQMLDMKPDSSVSNLSVQFGCSEAKKLAEQILSMYQLSQHNLDISEVNGELFNAAALYTACKKLKLKIDKNKLVACVGIKRSVFDRLVLIFEKISLDMHTPRKSLNVVAKDADLSPKNLTENILEEYSEGANNIQTVKDERDEEEEEPFHVWRERILTQARAALDRCET